MSDDEAKSPDPAWFEALHGFLGTLRADGWLIGPAEHIAVDRVLLALAQRRALPEDAISLAAVLGPIVSSNPREQEQFQRRFRAWAAEQGGLAPGPKAVKRKRRDRERVHQPVQPPPPANRPRQVAIGVGTILVLIYAALYFLDLLPGQSPNDPVGDKPPDKIESEQGSAQAPPPPPTEPPFPWLLWLGGIAAAWAVLKVYRDLRVQRWLARHSTLGSITVRRIPVRGVSGVTDDRRAQESAAVLLRTREHVQSDDIDVEATIDAMAEAAGLVTPMYATRRVTPEFVALVDRRSARDHQADVIDARLRGMSEHGVEITRFWYDSDPRYPSAEDADSTTPIEELTGRLGHNRLWLFADGDLVQDRETGEGAPWMDELKSWARRSLLTVEPSPNWGTAENLAEGSGLRVRPADVEGFQATLSEEPTPRPSLEDIDELPPMYPEALAEDPDAWLQNDAPDEDTVEWMLEELGDYLGEAGMAWLTACSIYPQLRYELTLYLGSRLRLDGTHSILDLDNERLAERRRRGHRYGTPSTLERLVRLPWFRVGWMPDWLRRRLIAEAPPEVERLTRSALRELLALETRSDHPDEFELEVAWEDRQGAIEGSGIDRVFLSAMGDPLYLRVPRQFLQRLRGGWRRARTSTQPSETPSERLAPLPIVTTWALPMMLVCFVVGLKFIGLDVVLLVAKWTEGLVGASAAGHSLSVMMSSVLLVWYTLVVTRRIVETSEHVKRRVLVDSCLLILLVAPTEWVVPQPFYVPVDPALVHLVLGPVVLGLVLGVPMARLVGWRNARAEALGGRFARIVLRVGRRLPDVWMQRQAEAASWYLAAPYEAAVRDVRPLWAALLSSLVISAIHFFVLVVWLVGDFQESQHWPIYLLPLLVYYAASTANQLPQRIPRPFVRLALELSVWVVFTILVGLRHDAVVENLNWAIWQRIAAGMALWVVLSAARAIVGRAVDTNKRWYIAVADAAESFLPDRLLSSSERSPAHRGARAAGLGAAMTFAAGLSLGCWTRFHDFGQPWVLWTLAFGALFVAGTLARGMFMAWPLGLTFTGCWWIANPAFEPLTWWLVFLLAVAAQMGSSIPLGRRQKRKQRDLPQQLAPLPHLTTWAVPPMLLCGFLVLTLLGLDPLRIFSDLLMIHPSDAPEVMIWSLLGCFVAWYVAVVARRFVERPKNVRRRVLLDGLALGLLAGSLLLPGLGGAQPPLRTTLLSATVTPIVGGAVLGLPALLLLAIAGRVLRIDGPFARLLVGFGSRMPDAWMQRTAERSSLFRPGRDATPLRPLRPLVSAVLTALGVMIAIWFVLVEWLIVDSDPVRDWPILLLAAGLYLVASTVHQLPQPIARPYRRLAIEVACMVVVALVGSIGLFGEYWSLWAAVVILGTIGVGIWGLLAGMRAVMGIAAKPGSAWPVELADYAAGFLPDRMLRRDTTSDEQRARVRCGMAILIGFGTGILLGAWTRFHGFEDPWILWSLMYGLLCFAGIVARVKFIPWAIVLAFALGWWMTNPPFEPLRWWMLFTLAVAVQMAVILSKRMGDGRILLAPLQFLTQFFEWPLKPRARKVLLGVGQVVGAVLLAELLRPVGIYPPRADTADIALTSTVILIVVSAQHWPRKFLVAGVALGVLGYVLVSGPFVVTLPNGQKVVSGFNLLTDEASDGDKPAQESPRSTLERLAAAGGDAEQIWTAGSIRVVNAGLGTTLGVALGSLLTLAAGVIFGSRSRGPRRIYISYRRSDTREEASRLYQELRSRGFEVFLDMESLGPVSDWRSAVRFGIQGADVILVLIGPAWLEYPKAFDRFSDPQPSENIREEIAYAVRSQKALVPVLVQGASDSMLRRLPSDMKPLTYQKALELRTDPDWGPDVDRLARALKPSEPRTPPDRHGPPRTPEEAGWW